MHSLSLRPSEIDMVLYHGGCNDGYVAAAVAKKFLDENFPERKVDYIPVYYSSPPPEHAGRNVLIVDFSYPKDILEKMLGVANSIAILDHHKTAEEALSSFPASVVFFDQNFSGASLAWDYFFPGEEAPQLVKYAEDRDLWRKSLPGHENYVAWFFTLPYDLDVCLRYFDDQLFLEELWSKGPAFAERDRLSVAAICKRACTRLCLLKFVPNQRPLAEDPLRRSDSKFEQKLVLVSHVNSPDFKSDVGNELLNLHPKIDFSAIYSQSNFGENTLFSLRSENSREDVSQYTRAFGGGGHRNAAGFTKQGSLMWIPGEIFEWHLTRYILEGGECLPERERWSFSSQRSETQSWFGVNHKIPGIGDLIFVKSRGAEIDLMVENYLFSKTQAAAVFFGLWIHPSENKLLPMTQRFPDISSKPDGAWLVRLRPESHQWNPADYFEYGFVGDIVCPVQRNS